MCLHHFSTPFPPDVATNRPPKDDGHTFNTRVRHSQDHYRNPPISHRSPVSQLIRCTNEISQLICLDLMPEAETKPTEPNGRPVPASQVASTVRTCTLRSSRRWPGMSNMRPFASTPAARTKDTVIWSFNGQNCSFYNLNWINVRRSQINSMLLFIQNKNKNIL